MSHSRNVVVVPGLPGTEEVYEPILPYLRDYNVKIVRYPQTLDQRFATVARGNPQLEAALPMSADIAALAGIGLDAVAAIESGRAPSTDWRGRAQELLDRQFAAEKASESIVQVVTMQQPPADLLISITPGIRKLVDAVATLGP